MVSKILTGRLGAARFCGCIAALCLQIPIPVRAADVAASGELEEVIVTAQRREENLQTVPIAITVLSQKTLEENNVQTLGDLQYLVPSLSSSSGLTRDSIDVSIRGVGANGTPLPGVVAYLNDVPIPTDHQGQLTGGAGLLFDLENAQVLKGPQGTLFGRNSVGGALLLQTARPTNEFGGNIQATYGNYNDREIDGAINIPIIDGTLLTRLAFTGQRRDGFTFLMGEPGYPNGINTDNRDDWAARGTVTFRPTEAFQNDTIFTYQTYTSNGDPHILVGVNLNGLGVLGGLPITALFPNYATLLGQQQALGIRVAIPVDTQLASSGSNLSLENISRVSIGDDLTLRNIVGFDKSQTIGAYDLDASTNSLADIPNTPRVEWVRQLTDEFQLLGKGFGGRLDWIVGAFVLNSENPPDGYVTQTQVVFAPPQTSTDTRDDQKSKALFAQGTYDLSALVSGLKFIAGARYTWDEFTSTIGPTGGPYTSGGAKDSAPTWTLGLDYDVTPGTLLYLSSRRGYRSGGSNGATVTGTPLPNYGPEYIDNFEFGVKSDWHLGSIPIRTNAAIYDQQYTDVQVGQTYTVGDIPYGIFANASGARVLGAEFEGLAQVTKDLEIGATFAYLDFRYTSFGPGVDGPLLLAERTNNAPPRKYGVSARYHLPLAAEVGDVSIRANWNWQSTSAGIVYLPEDVTNPGGTIAEFGLLNLAAEWNRVFDSSVDVSLFASNVLNKTYVVEGQSYYSYLGFAVQNFGDPRMYGIRLRYRFGAKGN